MADIIEGRNPVIEALKTGRPINKVLLAHNIRLHSAVAEILNLSKSRRIPVEYVERRYIDKLSVTSSHQGVIAYASIKEYVALEDLLTISSEKTNRPFIVSWMVLKTRRI